MKIRMTATLLAFAFLSGQVAAAVEEEIVSQEIEMQPAYQWQPAFDLITAGAAASVLLHHICQGASAGASAAGIAAKRLVAEAARLPANQDPTGYAREAYRLKLRAFEQTTSGVPCSNLTRLSDIARATGFDVPRR